MKNASLATTYRPQTFAEVAGQELIIKVLSRSAAQDKIAPAYLLSGTRGVGKTTIARILAKALNCIHAPQAEPCNKCDQCKKITQGNHVDVHEIDGASNNSVEDARAMRENIGYAPMEGRYKVFIIDEAHMLSRSAFNAMLKTLEEPPPRVVFIFATTEAHKFPITIVSRCQHFVLKRLTESQIITHLTGILQKEKVEFEPEAVKVISKRACGSVRDGMSLLGQSLALGTDILNAKSVRSILGMTSLDIYDRLIDAIVEQDCLELTTILKQMLDEGIDIGFFLREFTTLWRTLFLIKQDGNRIIASLDLSEDEAKLWTSKAQRFSLTHIHAAWHMVLESQKIITQSPEPSSALELLLLNISLMPKLLPMEKITNSSEFYTQDTSINKNSDGEIKKNISEQDVNSNTKNNLNNFKVSTPKDTETEVISPINTKTTDDIAESALIHQQSNSNSPIQNEQISSPKDDKAKNSEPVEFVDNAENFNYTDSDENLSYLDNGESFDYIDNNEQYVPDNSLDIEKHSDKLVQTKDSSEIPFNWKDLCKFIFEQNNEDIKQTVLRQTQGTFDKNTLTLETQSITVYKSLCRMKELIEQLAKSFFKNDIEIIIHQPQNLPKTKNELLADAETYAEIKILKEMFDACIEDCQPCTATKPNINIDDK